jgi:hypothetical protein
MRVVSQSSVKSLSTEVEVSMQVLFAVSLVVWVCG